MKNLYDKEYLTQGWGKNTRLPTIIAMIFMTPDLKYFDFICTECGKTKRIVHRMKKSHKFRENKPILHKKEAKNGNRIKSILEN